MKVFLAFVALACIQLVQANSPMEEVIAAPFSVKYTATIPKPSKEAKLLVLREMKDSLSADQFKTWRNKYESDSSREARFVVTVECNGPSLLYRVERQGKTLRIVLIKGGKTFDYDAEFPHLYLDPNASTTNVNLWPFFPFQLPALTLYRTTTASNDYKQRVEQSSSQHGILLDALMVGEGSSDGTPYSAVVAVPEAATSSRIGKLILGFARYVTYAEYRRFQGVDLPGSVTIEHYDRVREPSGDYVRSSVPVSSVKFTLAACSADPPESDFDIAAAMKAHAPVQYKGIAFAYDPANGNLEVQANKAYAKETTPRKVVQQSSEATSLVLLSIALAAIGAVVIIVMLRRRASAK